MSADLASLIRLRYPRLLERGNPLYDAVLAAAVEEQGKADVVTVPAQYLAMLESAANRFCSSCRDSDGCTMTTRHLGGLGCGAWKLDGARINALRSTPTTEATP